MKKQSYLWLAVMLAFSGTAFAMHGQPQSPEPRPKRLLVTFRETAVSEFEQSLPQGTVTAGAVQSRPSLREFFRKHRLQRIEPLYPDHVRERRRSGKTSVQIGADVRARFAQRARRALRSDPAIDLSRSYTLISDVPSDAELDAVAAALRQDPQIESVQTDVVYSASLVPNDPYFLSTPLLYGLHITSAAAAWDIRQGEGIIVAVSDSGIDYNHPDLAANVWTDPMTGWHGYDFVNNDSNPIDDFGHGTHVAGTIAAVGNNNIGIIGMAFKSKVMAMKGLGAGGSGFSSQLAPGIVWATDHGADVINMSWNSLGAPDTALRGALQYAAGQGVILVASAGNNTSDVANYMPANSPNVIAVSALDENDQLAYFSNYGNKIDVGAPGMFIVSLQAAGTALGSPVSPGYIFGSGTSMAAPHVAGLAALIVSNFPNYTNEQVRQTLHHSADKVNGWDFSPNAGYGRINALRALQLGEVPTVFLSSPIAGTFTAAMQPLSGTAQGAGFLNYQLSYASGSFAGTFYPILTSPTPVVNGQLGIWDTTALADGPYHLRLTVNTSTRAYISKVAPVYVDRSSPTVVFTAPAENAAIPVNTPTPFNVTAQDASGIQFVVYSLDGVGIGTDVLPPFTHNIALPTVGPHVVTARAVDMTGKYSFAQRNVIGVSVTPTITMTAPAQGATLTQMDTIQGTSSNAVFVTIEIDGLSQGNATSTLNNWYFPLRTEMLSNGPHTITARATSVSGGTAAVSRNVSISNPGPAAFSAALQVPLCSTAGAVCHSGPLHRGRGLMTNGSEPNQPNTLIGSPCADGNAGTFHGSGASIDLLRIATQDGTPLAAGKIVQVEALVWTPNTFDFLDIYYAANASSPAWTRIKSQSPIMSGVWSVLSATFTLTTGDSQQAIRVNYRTSLTPAVCTTGTGDDHDDLAFRVELSNDACDTNDNGATDVTDVQQAVNEALGAVPCSRGDVSRDGLCNVLDIQRVVVAILDGICTSP